MDERTDMEKVTAEVMDNALVDNLAKLQEKLSHSGMFLCDNLRLKISNDIGSVTIPMQQQQMADDIITELTRFLDVNILYAYKTHDGSTYKMVAYTMPYDDEMYVVFVDSEQYGIVEEIHIAFFESLNVMFDWLRNDYDAVLDKDGKVDIIQLQNLSDLYRDFL